MTQADVRGGNQRPRLSSHLKNQSPSLEVKISQEELNSVTQEKDVQTSNLIVTLKLQHTESEKKRLGI